jgi:hypothetical protein
VRLLFRREGILEPLTVRITPEPAR